MEKVVPGLLKVESGAASQEQRLSVLLAGTWLLAGGDSSRRSLPEKMTALGGFHPITIDFCRELIGLICAVSD